MASIYGACDYCSKSYLVPTDVDEVTALTCSGCGQTITLESVVRPTTIYSGKEAFTIDGAATPEILGIYKVYPAIIEERGLKRPCLMHIAKDQASNSAAEYEARILNHLLKGTSAKEGKHYLPTVIKSFIVDGSETGKRWCNVFENPDGWYSLKAVRAKFRNGVDPKDMAWMFRRLLVPIAFAHTNNVLHCAVLPSNIRIHPEAHALQLWDWQYALGPEKRGSGIQGADPEFQSFYPNAVMEGIPPTTGTDVYMAMMCMKYILEGGTTPPEMSAFLDKYLEDPIAEVDVRALLEEFDKVIHDLWGERKFHPFSMT